MIYWLYSLPIERTGPPNKSHRANPYGHNLFAEYPTFEETPEKSLAYAVLKLGIQDLFHEVNGTAALFCSYASTALAKAKEWYANEDPTEWGSFNGLCNNLEICPQRLRKAVNSHLRPALSEFPKSDYCPYLHHPYEDVKDVERSQALARFLNPLLNTRNKLY